MIPAYNEGAAIIPHLHRILEAIELPCEVLVVVDADDDTTLPPVLEFMTVEPRVRAVVSTYGRGPARAIRYGFDQAAAPVVVVTMADGCDDPRQIDTLTFLVERGVVIAAASRYMRGGQQVGGPALKSLMSRTAGTTLQWFGRVGTHDATNSFKAYDRDFVREVGIESDAGFEIGIELVAKARRRRLPVAEIPTIWLDRAFGESRFKTREWAPLYLKWYRHAFGRESENGAQK